MLHVDWERERGLAKAEFPSGSGPSTDTVLTVLRRVIVDQLGDKHFRHYDELGDRESRALGKLEASMSPQVPGSNSGGEAGSRALHVLRAALAVGSVVGVGLLDEQIAELAKVGVDEVRTLLTQAQHRMRATLTAQERELISNPMPTRAAAFAEALRSAAAKRPLVVLMDTYEIVQQTGPWLRAVMARCGPRVGWVLAGRLEDPEPGLPGELPDFRRDVYPGGRLRVIELKGFSSGEAGEYFRDAVPARPTGGTEFADLYRATSGIPLAVGVAAARWRDGEAASAIIADRPLSDDRTPLTHLLTTRFLTHTEQDDDPHGDWTRLLALALVSTPEDQELVSTLWDVPDARTVLREMAARHDVVLVGTLRLHSEVRDVFRGFLRDPGNRGGQVRLANRRVIRLLEARLADRDARLPTLQDRAADKPWRQYVSALAWHRFWDDFEAGWDTVRSVFPAAMVYSRQLGIALLDDAEQFATADTDHDRAELRALRTVISGRLWSHGHAEALAALERRPLTDGVRGDEDCAGERTAILRWQKGKSLVERGRAQAALQEYQAAARGLPEGVDQLRRGLADDLVTFADNLTRPAGSSQPVPSSPGLTAAQLATRLSPDNPETWRAFSHAGFALRQYARALEAIDQAAELDPDNARIHVDRAYLFSWLSDWTGMREAAERAVRADPADPETHVCLSSALLSQRRRPEALAAARDALAADQFSASAHIQLAEVLQALRNFAGGFTAANEAVRLSPHSVAGHLCRSGVLINLKRLDDALAAAREACAVDPKNQDGRMQEALVLALKRDWPGYLDSAKHAIRLDPANSKPHLYRSDALVKLVRFPEALAAARTALDHGPDDPDTHHQLSMVHSRLKEHEPALRSAERAVEIDRTQVKAHIRRCDVLIDMGRPTDALAVARTAVEQDPDDPGAHFELSVVHSWLRDRQAALSSAELAIKIDPAYVQAHVRRSEALIDLRRHADALAAATDACAADKEDPAGHIAVGDCLLWTEEYAQALPHYRLAADLDPTKPQPVRCQAVALDGLRRFDEALEHYRAALRLDPDDGGLHAWLGTALMSAGQYDEALAEIDRAIELDPTVPTFWQFHGDILALRSGRKLDARPDYDRAAEVATDLFEVPVCQGDAAWLHGRLDETEQLWLAARRLAPWGDLRLTVGVGVLATLRDDHDQAAERFRTSLSCQRDPWSSGTTFERAQLRAIALAGLGRVDDALRLLAEQSANRRPGDRHALTMLDLLAEHPPSTDWSTRIRTAVLAS